MLFHLRLLENEEILFETKTINKKNKRKIRLIVFNFIFLVMFFFIVNFFVLIKILYLFLFFNFLMIFVIFGIFFDLEVIDLPEIRSIYVITNRRVVKVRGNGLIKKNLPIHEIYLEDIAFIQIGSFIYIAQKGPRGEIHYNGNEIKSFYIPKYWKTYFFSPMFEELNLRYKVERQSSHIEQKIEFNYITVRVKAIRFNIKGKNTIHIREKIIDLLTDLIPLKKHPNLDNVYLNTS